MRHASSKRYGRARSKQHSHGQAIALSPEKHLSMLMLQVENAQQTGVNLAIYQMKLDELLHEHPELQRA